MVTLNKITNTNRPVYLLLGLSTDIKPINDIEGIIITNGSIFREIDTSIIYKFDFENKIWIKQKLNGSGETGDSSSPQQTSYFINALWAKIIKTAEENEEE